jgi:hypothetical protein
MKEKFKSMIVFLKYNVVLFNLFVKKKKKAFENKLVQTYMTDVNLLTEIFHFSLKQ